MVIPPRVSPRVPTCVWRISAELVVALDGRFGEPLDAYVNGSQVWVRDDGPNEICLEWRLHPVSRFRRPTGVATDELFSAVALAAAQSEAPPAAVQTLWDGLEAFPAYGDDVEPALLAAATTAALGMAPDAFGLADHAVIGDAWEASSGAVSIIDALFGQLAS